ncbi:ribonuclease E inhibitor RraB [Acinetobacter tianfuensis]|uniref:Ribonuclease E inhibitor RraB n=1 Tax=Acinetobacter tianfuensis TaxID=2419603 RepID=A0A3A8EKH1_9GAMM|nr:ribonuclease E inhibitor RraB [Acinetobacter tianfuensis]RKG29391.1 ribonuclease E inhibitor RraB [Acinetobacter tianfuensis]
MSRDYKQFPDDDNGNVLWQMHEDGDDLTEAHEIEYSIAFSSEEKADQCAIYLLKEEQKITLFEDEDSNEWVVTIYVYMEPEYEDIVDLEEWFTKIAGQFEGEYDGWGCMAYVYDDEEDDDLVLEEEQKAN